MISPSPPLVQLIEGITLPEYEYVVELSVQMLFTQDVYDILIRTRSDDNYSMDIPCRQGIFLNCGIAATGNPHDMIAM